jgi:hypothetical protein
MKSLFGTGFGAGFVNLCAQGFFSELLMGTSFCGHCHQHMLRASISFDMM